MDEGSDIMFLRTDKKIPHRPSISVEHDSNGTPDRMLYRLQNPQPPRRDFFKADSPTKATVSGREAVRLHTRSHERFEAVDGYGGEVPSKFEGMVDRVYVLIPDGKDAFYSIELDSESSEFKALLPLFEKFVASFKIEEKPARRDPGVAP